MALLPDPAIEGSDLFDPIVVQTFVQRPDRVEAIRFDATAPGKIPQVLPWLETYYAGYTAQWELSLPSINARNPVARERIEIFSPRGDQVGVLYVGSWLVWRGVEEGMRIMDMSEFTNRYMPVADFEGYVVEMSKDNF